MSDKDESRADIGSLVGSRTLHRQTKEVLDYVQQGGEPVVILRYGRPAAALVPIDDEQAKTVLLAASLRERGSVRSEDDGGDSPIFAVSESDAGSELVQQEELVGAAAARLRAMQVEVAQMLERTRTITEASRIGGELPEALSARTLVNEVAPFTTQHLTGIAQLADSLRASAAALNALCETDIAAVSVVAARAHAD